MRFLGFLLIALSAGAQAQTSLELVSVSPDGKHAAVAFQRDGAPAVAVMERSPVKILDTKALPKEFRVREIFWPNARRVVIEAEDLKDREPGNPDKNKIVAMNFNGNEALQIFPAAGKTSDVRVASRALIEDKYLMIVDSKEALGDAKKSLRLLDIVEGKTKPYDDGPEGAHQILIDGKGEARVAYSGGGDTNVTIHTRHLSKKRWYPVEDAKIASQKMQLLGFAADDTTFYFTAAGAMGKQALFSAQVDPLGSIDKVTEIAAEKSADLSGAYFDPVSKTPIFAQFGKIRKYVSQGSLAKELAELDKSFKGDDVRPVDQFEGGILLSVAAKPYPKFYVYDRKAGTVKPFKVQ